MRSTMLLLEQNLGRSVFWKAAAELRDMIDWGGGDGETVYQMVREDYPTNLPEDYDEGVNTSRFKRWLRQWSYDEVEVAFDTVRRLFQGNMIKVWRVITAPATWKVDQQHPGIYWSWEMHAAEAHWGAFSGGDVAWEIAGEIAFQDVDWPSTLAGNAHPSYAEEKEIRLIEGRPVKILGVRRR